MPAAAVTAKMARAAAFLGRPAAEGKGRETEGGRGVSGEGRTGTWESGRGSRGNHPQRRRV